jgi:hypothetical protein
MKYLKATVIRMGGPDLCAIETDLISPLIYYSNKCNLILHFEATASEGPGYIKEHFGLDAEVIESSSSRF